MSNNHNKFAKNLRLLASPGLLSPVLFLAWPNAMPTSAYIIQGGDLATVAASTCQLLEH